MEKFGFETKAKDIKAVLLDITGVLYSGSEAISGSIDAVKRLRDSGYPLRFCTNETQHTRKNLSERLRNVGFNLSESELFPPVPAMCAILKKRGLRPHVLVHPDVVEDFSEVDQSDPNCVVIADAADTFTYYNLNKAFQLLISMEKPILFSLGMGKYYEDGGTLHIDVGAYTKALEYACDIQAEVVGKPSRAFFHAPLQDMGIKPENVMMVGDDILNDVGGAQACGMVGVQVRTGKFRPKDEHHPHVKPDAIVDNLAGAVDLLLKYR